MRFFRQEYWSGLPFHSLSDIPSPGIEPVSSALAVGFFTIVPPVKPQMTGHRRNYTLVAVSNSIQILVFRSFSNEKDQDPLGAKADSRQGIGNIQNEPRAFMVPEN